MTTPLVILAIIANDLPRAAFAAVVAVAFTCAGLAVFGVISVLW